MTVEPIATARPALRLGDPPLYLVVDPPRPATSHHGPTWAKLGERVGVVHVISHAAGGEVRGYWRMRGALWLREPAEPWEWPEVDGEVARVLMVGVMRWR